MSEIKLKPYPFCGGKAVYINLNDERQVAAEKWNRRAGEGGETE